MSDTPVPVEEEVVEPVAIPDDIIAEMTAAEERSLGPEQFTVPSTPINDFLQIASGGGAIVESQAEWAAEGGILNNGFPTGIVLQEQYNKAWRQSTSWIRALGWHASQLIQQNVLDDGNSEKLWRQLYEAYLVQHVVFDTAGTNSYTTPNTFGLSWTSPPRAGTEITLWITNANTSTACTLNFAGTGIYPIKHLDGTLPRVGDVRGHVKLSFSSSTWYIDCISMFMLNLRIGDLIWVSGNTTVYISPTGNDSTGNGTVGSPWQTLQFAYNKLTAQYFNLGGFALVIQMADGIYTTGLTATKSPLGFPSVGIRGNPSNPAAVRVVTTAQACFYASNNAVLSLQGISVQCNQISTNVGGSGVAVQYGGQIALTDFRFEYCDWAHIFSTFGGSVVTLGSITITAGAGQAHYYLTSGATLTAAGSGQTCQVHLSGTPVFGTAFAVCSASFLYAPYQYLTFDGTGATGSRYFVGMTGVIDTQGNGAFGGTLFPGTIAGVAMAAQYSLYL